jgi:hypothetical protein
MNKRVWIILGITFLMLGLFDTARYFTLHDAAGRDVDTPQFYEFWGFVAVVVIGGIAFWYRRRRNKS